MKAEIHQHVYYCYWNIRRPLSTPYQHKVKHDLEYYDMALVVSKVRQLLAVLSTADRVSLVEQVDTFNTVLFKKGGC